jgi:uncharacterized membrane protein YbhN (UPF0104 family)
MNFKNKQFILWFITIAIAVIAFVIINRLYISARDNGEYIFHLWGVFLALFVAVFQQVLAPAFSIYALKSIGQSSSYLTMLWISTFSTSANSTVPFPAGIPIRAVLQKKILGVSYTASASGMLLESIVGYSSLVIICIVSGLLWLGPALRQQVSILRGPVIAGLILIGIFSTLGLLYFALRRMRGRFVEYLRNAGKLLSNANITLLCVMVLVIIFLDILVLIQLSLIIYSLGLSVALGPLIGAVFFAYLMGVLSFVPMGLGVRDVSLTSFLVMLGIPMEHAAAVAAIYRVLTTLPFLIGGVIATHALGKQVISLSVGDRD